MLPWNPLDAATAPAQLQLPQEELVLGNETRQLLRQHNTEERGWAMGYNSQRRDRTKPRPSPGPVVSSRHNPTGSTFPEGSSYLSRA